MKKKFLLQSRNGLVILLTVILSFSAKSQSLSICNDTLYLTSPTNDYSSNNFWGLQAHSQIRASNKIQGQAKVQLQSQSIQFLPGFKVNSANGAVLETQLAAYQPIGQFPLIAILKEPAAGYGGFCVDAYGGVYKVNELIIKMNPNIPQASVGGEARAAITNIQNANPGLIITEDTCGCNPYLRVWRAVGLEKLNHKTIIDQGGPSSTATGGRVRDVELNYYATADVANTSSLPIIPPIRLNDDIAGVNIGAAGNDGFIIALLDNGVNYNASYFSLNSDKFTFWKNPNEIINGIDDDNNGYIDDIMGYNFVSNNNNPLNNTGTNGIGHGSEVLSFIINQLNIPAIPIKAITEKVTDERGIGENFSVYCAMYHAMQKGAKVINMSLGAYQAPNETDVLKGIMKDMNNNNVIVVAAAGNGIKIIPTGDVGSVSLDDSELKFYPASLSDEFDNIYSVTGVLDTLSVCYPLNYGASYVDIGVQGYDCTYLCPINNQSLAGTSFATPIISAAVIRKYYNWQGRIIPYKSEMLRPDSLLIGTHNTTLEQFIKNGIYYSY